MADHNLQKVQELRLMIGTTRKEIKETFLKTQKDVMHNLEEKTRKTEKTQETKVEDVSKLLEIVKEVEGIKGYVQSTLKPLQRVDSKAGETEEEKGKKTDGSNSEWPNFDCKLEHILENAAQSYKLSEFDKLDPKLKICLLCFAIFPQGAKIKKRTMIYWWIGEGIAKASDNETAEENGEKCFQDLIQGSWIDPVNNKSSKIVRECTLDPWVRWLVIFKARELNFFDLDETGMPYPYSPSSRSKSHRACLVSTKKKQLDPQNTGESSNRGRKDGSGKDGLGKEGLGKEGSSKEGSGKECSGKEGLVPLSTVFNVNTECLNFQNLLKKQDSIRHLHVLQLGRWQRSARHHIELDDEDFELSKQFGHLKTLRYLSLSGIFRIRKLPKWISKLRNLQILDLRDCQNLEQLGENVRYLQNLTHLDVSECYLLDHMPKGLSSLLKLEVLKGFVFGSLGSSDQCRLLELTNLQKLKKLSINLGTGEQIKQDEMNVLQDIENLRSLAITWGSLLETLSAKEKENVMENMRFPPNLEKLDLRCFPEECPPKWLEASGFGNLKKLFIRGGKLKTFVIPQETYDNSWKVKMLRLKYLHYLDEKWPEVEKFFPDLTYLEVHECADQRQWPPVDKEGVWLQEEKPDTNVGDTDVAATAMPASTTTPPSVDSTQDAVTPVVDTNVGDTDVAATAATAAPTSITTTRSVDSTQAAVAPLVDTNVGDTDVAATAAPTSTTTTTTTSVGSVPSTDAPANLSSSANNEEEIPSHTTISTDVAPQVTPNLTSPPDDDASVADSSNQDHGNTPSPPPPDLASPRDDASVADSSNQDHGNTPPPPPPPPTTNGTLTSAPPSTPVDATVDPSSTTSNQEQNPSPTTTTTDIPTVTPPTPDSTLDSSPPKSSPTTTTTSTS